MHTLHLLEIRASKSELVMNLNVPCKLKKGMLDLVTLDKEKMSQVNFHHMQETHHHGLIDCNNRKRKMDN
jgi:hypothetical protein